MNLYAKNMHFLGNTKKDKSYDCCVHGKVVLQINDHMLVDNSDCCISASAYRFLHTLFDNHFIGSQDFLFPCCGHTIIPTNDKRSVTIIGCDNGIDFNILHKNGNVTITKTDNTKYHITFAEYKNMVLLFAKQVMDFYKSSPPREFENDFDKDGFSAFVTEWYALYDKAIALTDNSPKTSLPSLEDYEIFTESEITNISTDGISLNSFRFINFKECAYNFKEIEGDCGKCIGDRDIKNLSFTFYTSHTPITIKFIESNKLKEFFSRKNVITRFHNLQKQIEQFGYTTRDLS